MTSFVLIKSGIGITRIISYPTLLPPHILLATFIPTQTSTHTAVDMCSSFISITIYHLDSPSRHPIHNHFLPHIHHANKPSSRIHIEIHIQPSLTRAGIASAEHVYSHIHIIYSSIACRLHTPHQAIHPSPGTNSLKASSINLHYLHYLYHLHPSIHP